MAVIEMLKVLQLLCPTPGAVGSVLGLVGKVSAIL